MKQSTAFRSLMSSDKIIVAPGAYDGITASMIEHAEFPAVYMTGAGTAATLGYPDFKKWRFAYFLQNIENEQGGDDPTTIDCGNASLLLEASASGVTDLRSQIAKMEEHAASYDKLVARP